jgi:predicted nucleic acid-binding Zn ribbon protein|tara:strand:+ start:193 stop:324 length:132 start_codon:yes stop_codon:yes gene_type:complete
MPHCNTCFDEIKMVKKISATSFVLKGSGFYKTDYVDKTSDKAK